MEPLFDVYVTGETLDGFHPTSVIADLARLFGIDETAAARLVDGTKRRVKANCDKATALKYRETLSNIGASVVIERQARESSGHGAVPDSASSAVTGIEQPSDPASAVVHESWELAPTGALMSDPDRSSAAPTVTVPAYDLAEPGALIPSIKAHLEPIEPDISHLHLRPIEP